MTKISTYNIDDNVTANDKWIGSDVNNFNKTKNFTPKKLAIYFNGSQVINTGMELLYKYFTITPPETRPVGTISFENEIGPVVSFSSITTFLISKYTQKGNEVNEFLGFLVGTKSLLYKADDVNVFGYYDIVSIDPYIDDNNFYVVTLSFIEGNGSIEEDKDYMISMIDINPTEAQDLQNVTDIGSITTNTITAEAFIKHDGDGTNLLLDDGTTIPLNDVGNQSLQDVTDVGNTTDNTIIIDSTNYYSSLGPDAVGTENKDTGTYTYIGADGLLGIKNETVESQLKNTDVTSSGVILEFPNKASGSYTIATTDDVPTTPGLQQVTDEGSTTTNSITAESFIKDGGDGTNLLLDDGATIPLADVGNQDLQSVLDNTSGAVDGQIILYSEGALSQIDSYSAEGIGIIGRSDNGIGVKAFSHNKSLEVELDNNTQIGINISSETDSTGTPLKVTKNNVTKLSINQEGELTATKLIKEGGTGNNILLDDGSTIAVSSIDGTVTSVGVSMPSAFTVTNSPVETSGTISVTGAGLASQYIRGDGQLASFPDIAGGGGGQVYYCNGGTSQGTIGGNAFYQISTGASLATGVDFTSGTANNIAFANFITDIGKPTQEVVPAGVWIFQCYLSASATNDLEVYATVEIYNGSTFNVLATSLVEVLTGGTNIDLYTFTCAVPEYDPLVTADRIAIRFYPSNLSGGRTITLHTQNSHLSSIQTTFTTGLASLNGLTSASQLFATGTSGNDFYVNSTDATHTFNIPNASSVSGRRGLLIADDWTTFNSKEPAITIGTTSQYWRGDKSFQTLNTAAVPELTNLYYTDSRARLALSSTATGLTYTDTTGVFSLTSGYSIPTNTSQTNWNTAYTSRIATFTVTGNSGAATFSGNILNIPEYTISGLNGAGLALANTFTNINTITKNDSVNAIFNVNNSLAGGGIFVSSSAGIAAEIRYGAASGSIGVRLYGDSDGNGIPLAVYDGGGLVAQISSGGVISGSQLKVSGGFTTGFLKANGDIDSRTFSTGGGTATGTNTGDVTLNTNSGLSFTSGQTLLTIGTPSNITSSSVNSVTTSTHTHQITPSLGFIGSGSAQYQVLVTGATTFTPTWTSSANIYGSSGLNSLSLNINGLVRVIGGGSGFTVDTTTYATGSGTATGTNTGDETAARIGVLINGSVTAVPNDADFVATADTSVLKKITWTNVKAFLKTYFDTLYSDKIYNITITTGGVSTISTDTTSTVGAYSQNGRNVMIDNGTVSTTINVNSGSGSNFIASYTKLSASGVNIMFATGTATLQLLGSTAILSGAIGSTALLTRNGTGVYYLQVNNL